MILVIEGHVYYHTPWQPLVYVAPHEKLSELTVSELYALVQMRRRFDQRCCAQIN